MGYHFVLLSILFGISIVLITVPSEIFAEKECVPIDLEYTVNGAIVTDICKNKDWMSVTITMIAQEDENITLTVPKKYATSLESMDCQTGPPFVIMDGSEILPTDLIATKFEHIISFDFTKGEHIIEIVGSEIIPHPSPSMLCGIVLGYDSQYLPPRIQTERGVELRFIQCNDDYQLVVKHDGSPACVKPETIPKLIERGWGESVPEPESLSIDHQNLIHAKKLLQTAYHENISLGPLRINDVIVGFGIGDGTLMIDVLYRYSTSSEMDIVKKKIRNIVGDEIKIEYVPYKEPSRFIQKALVYHWNEYLHKNSIEFAPAYPSHGNNDDGIGDGTFLCSPLVAPNGTEFYIVSTVIVEPFLITDTFIDIEKPDFCRKTWKTDVVLEEPDRVISLWLEMGQGKIQN